MTKTKTFSQFVTEATEFGSGWFHNLKTGKTHSIETEDLGPHGDHDGWIGVGDNAEKLGIDPKKAKAFQDATYGNEAKGINSHWIGEEDADPEAFHREHGIDKESAAHIRFPDLVRIRHWPDNTLSIVHHGDTQKHFRKIQDAVAGLGLKHGNVQIEGNDGNY